MAGMTKAVSSMTIKPSMSLSNDATTGSTVVPDALNPADKTYNGTSSPPGTKYAADDVTLPGQGAQSLSIDLTNLTDVEGITVTGEGLKVQEFRCQADSDNVAVITIQGGDADPYELFGSGKSVDVQPGGLIHMRFNDGLADIVGTTATTETDIKFSGTGGDGYTYEFIMG